MPKGWSRKFDEPIPLPKGKPLLTLRDAASYITKLPKVEHQADEWQAAMQALLLVVEQNGPTMFARVGVMRALNRHVERVFCSRQIRRHSLNLRHVVVIDCIHPTIVPLNGDASPVNFADSATICEAVIPLNAVADFKASGLFAGH
jgi:hypothetical protein